MKGSFEDAHALGDSLARKLLEKGADKILEELNKGR
jgi:hypothetical protein